MFCSACGKDLPNEATACPTCGAPVPQAVAAAPRKKFCRNCGAENDFSAGACTNCGAHFVSMAVGGKDFLTALLLCIFLGFFGIHRFYTGNIGIGIAQALTLGGCGIWWLVNIILIVAGTYRDGNGNPLVGR